MPPTNETENRIKAIQHEKENLKKELLLLKKLPSSNVAYLFLTLGLVSILLSIVHSNNILSIVGISITFWGSLLLYVKPTQFIRKDIFDAVLVGYYSNLHMQYSIKQTKTRPKYRYSGSLTDLTDVSLIIQKDSLSQTVPDEINSSDLSSIKITPSGIELSRLIEKEMNINLASLNLTTLNRNLEKVIVNNLEIAQSLEMDILDEQIKITITRPIFENIISYFHAHWNHLPIIDPLSSSMACVITIVSNKLIYLNDYLWDVDNKILKLDFKMEL